MKTNFYKQALFVNLAEAAIELRDERRQMHELEKARNIIARPLHHIEQFKPDIKQHVIIQPPEKPEEAEEFKDRKEDAKLELPEIDTSEIELLKILQKEKQGISDPVPPERIFRNPPELHSPSHDHSLTHIDDFPVIESVQELQSGMFSQPVHASPAPKSIEHLEDKVSEIAQLRKEMKSVEEQVKQMTKELVRQKQNIHPAKLVQMQRKLAILKTILNEKSKQHR